MKSSPMPLSKAYDCLIAYFEAQKEENRIFNLSDAKEYLASGDKSSLKEQPEMGDTADALHDFVKAVPFLDEKKIGISTALARLVVNLKELKTLNIEQGLFLKHNHVKMKNGSAIRKLRIEPGSTLLGAKPPMPSAGRELLGDPDGLNTAVNELKLAIKGNILDASQDSYAQLSGIVSAFEDLLTSVKENDFTAKVKLFTAEKDQGAPPPSNILH